MRLAWAHFKAETLALIRFPTALLLTVGFPILFFLFLAVPNARSASDAGMLMASYTLFAVLSAMLFQFATGLAEERALPWNQFLRSLPVSTQTRFGVRVFTAVVLASVTGLVIVLLALLLIPVDIMPLGWVRLLLVLVLGSVPFALLGVALGSWLPPRTVLPSTTLVFFGLAFAGGLLITPARLPDIVARISPYLPTRQWAELAWAAVSERPWTTQLWLWLLAYTLILGALASWGYWRNERHRY